MNNQVEINSTLLFLLSVSKHLLHKHTDVISYQKFTNSINGQCICLHGLSDFKSAIVKLNYTFQTEYPSAEISTKNIFAITEMAESIKVIHYMVDLRDNNVRIKLFTVYEKQDPVENLLANVPFRPLMGFVTDVINKQLSVDHGMIDYNKMIKPFLNDHHMGTTMYESEPFNILKLDQLLMEL